MFEEYKNRAIQAITEINTLKPKIIELFINYYGSEYATHIIQIINSVNFVFSYNGKYITSSKFDIENSDITFIKEKLSANKESLLGETFCYTKFNPPIINLGSEVYINGLDLHSLIHELNHMMHAIEITPVNLGFSSSIMDIIGKPNVNKIKIGITDDNVEDVFYKIINEYMTREILKKSQISAKANHYVIIDRLINNKIYNFFKVYEDKIKESLISQQPDKIFSIINEDSYLFIRSKIQDLYYRYCEFNIKYSYNLNDAKEYDVNLEINEFKKQKQDYLSSFINDIDTILVDNLGENSNKL